MKQARRTSFDVVTIGAATRDVFVKSRQFERIPSDSAPDGWNACLPLGAKIPVDELAFETGGGATNAAVTFARFGLATACVSRVGDDPGGREILARLKEERIDASGVQRDPKNPTAYSFILVAGTGQRAILVARGASAHLDQRKINWKKMSSKWIYLTSVAGNLALLKDLFGHARRSLTRIAWNPGNGEIEHGLKKLLPHFLQTDVLVLNREEAAALSDCSPRDLPCIFKTLGPLPRLALVVTDGARGAYATARGVTWHVPAMKGKIVNTTGAGDAFGSALVASLMKEGNIEDALRAAALNAFSVITHMGATSGILKTYPAKKELVRVKTKRISR